MGSKSKSKTASTTSQVETNTNVADYSQGDGTRTTTTGNNNTVSITATDFGTVAGAMGLAGDSLDKAFGFGSDALDLVDSQGQRALDAVSRSVSATQALAAQSEASHRDTVQTALQLAETVKTGGEAQATRLVIGMVIALIITGGVVAVAMQYNKSKG